MNGVRFQRPFHLRQKRPNWSLKSKLVLLEKSGKEPKDPEKDRQKFWRETLGFVLFFFF